MCFFSSIASAAGTALRTWTSRLLALGAAAGLVFGLLAVTALASTRMDWGEAVFLAVLAGLGAAYATTAARLGVAGSSITTLLLGSAVALSSAALPLAGWTGAAATLLLLLSLNAAATRLGGSCALRPTAVPLAVPDEHADSRSA